MTEITEAKLSPQARNALIALIVGGIAAILDSTLVTLAIRMLAVKLHSSTGTMQWVVTGFMVAMAVAIPITGWAERRWGGKRVWMAALLLFALASILSASAWNATSLVGFRVLQGFAAGLMIPLMQTLVVRAADGHVSSRLMAAVSLPAALGPIFGPVIGGVILNWLSWRWLFLVNVPLIAVGLLLAWRFLPTDRPGSAAGRTRLDWIGLVLLAPGLAGILLGLSQLSEDGGIGHAGVLAPLSAGVALLAAFVAWASRPGERRPIVDIRLLRRRSLGSASTVLFAAGAATYAAMFLLPLYYQQLRGDGVLDAGLLMIPQGVGALAARFAVGTLVDRLGARAVTIAGFALAAVATVPFALAGAGTSQWWLGGVLLVRGLGIGAVLIPPMSVAYHDVAPTDIPHATMNTRIAQQVGASFGTAIVAVALQSLLGHGLTARLPERVLVGDRHHRRRGRPRRRPPRREGDERPTDRNATARPDRDQPPTAARPAVALSEQPPIRAGLDRDVSLRLGLWFALAVALRPSAAGRDLDLPSRGQRRGCSRTQRRVHVGRATVGRTAAVGAVRSASRSSFQAFRVSLSRPWHDWE